MLLITKIFRFEMAHAIHGYNGSCRNIHGHSYELQVTVAQGQEGRSYIPAPGFIMDFKELKQLVQSAVVSRMDHQVILSSKYLDSNPDLKVMENLWIWEAEPTAENLLLYMQEAIGKQLPLGLWLKRLKLYETNDSYAEWINSKTV